MVLLFFRKVLLAVAVALSVAVSLQGCGGKAGDPPPKLFAKWGCADGWARLRTVSWNVQADKQADHHERLLKILDPTEGEYRDADVVFLQGVDTALSDKLKKAYTSYEMHLPDPPLDRSSVILLKSSLISGTVIKALPPAADPPQWSDGDLFAVTAQVHGVEVTFASFASKSVPTGIHVLKQLVKALDGGVLLIGLDANIDMDKVDELNKALPGLSLSSGWGSLAPEKHTTTGDKKPKPTDYILYTKLSENKEHGLMNAESWRDNTGKGEWDDKTFPSTDFPVNHALISSDLRVKLPEKAEPANSAFVATSSVHLAAVV